MGQTKNLIHISKNENGEILNGNIFPYRSTGNSLISGYCFFLSPLLWIFVKISCLLIRMDTG